MKQLRAIFRRIYYFRSYINFKKVGKNLMLGPGGLIARPKEIVFGSNVYIARNFHISARKLTIGSNIMIGPNLVIECDNHIFNKVGVTMFNNRNSRFGDSVNIEDDIWIGANVSILADVTIGEGAIVGAGSIVNKNLPPYSICVGNPCKPIKTRFTANEMEKHLLQVNSKYKLDDILKQWQLYNLK